MSVTSGRTLLAPLAFYGRDGSSGRTWLVTCLWGSTSWSGTWPRWGMTRGGELFELPTPELPTVGLVSSSLLPTPTAANPNEAERLDSWEARRELNKAKGINGNGQGTPLGIAVRQLLPTPSAADGMGGHLTRSGERSDELLLPGLAQAAAAGKLLPTPLGLGRGEGRPEPAGGSGDLRFSSAVHLLPTPTAMDAKASGGSTPSDVTLTDAVVRTSLGARTNPRFDGGNASPAPLPLPPNPGRAARNASVRGSASG